MYILFNYLFNFNMQYILEGKKLNMQYTLEGKKLK